jgi:hypothetical protein
MTEVVQGMARAKTDFTAENKEDAERRLPGFSAVFAPSAVQLGIGG